MKSGAQILWELIGRPTSEKTSECVDHPEEPCWVCAGNSSRGMPIENWNGASFTGQNRVKAPTGNFVCEPCVFVTSRIAPVPGRPAKEGKTYGGSFNNFSHRLPRTRGDRPAVTHWLLECAARGWGLGGRTAFGFGRVKIEVGG